MTARHPEHGTLWQAAADPQIYEEEDYYEISEGEKKGPEAMFEKPLTPSDVSKLNRLVIPKQYAERYFPLDLESNERGGLTLSFVDEAGKMWRFRYSYWTSSQSYVLTKGWSRYVKEKQLEAGDIVSFLQGQRLHHIRWRRQESSPEVAALPLPPALMPLASWGTNFYHPGGAPMFVGARQHQEILLHAGQEMVDSSAAVNSKRVRLFGVNLD